MTERLPMLSEVIAHGTKHKESASVEAANTQLISVSDTPKWLLSCGKIGWKT
ncbi:hypothetical protein VB10N_17820 [Vibrio sp. 10N]|nr:hypothetical protein VB10N_17820 [Vibrio sp. 10N]